MVEISLVVTSLVPSFNPPRGKEGLVNIVQHFCTSARILAAKFDWLMWQLSQLY